MPTRRVPAAYQNGLKTPENYGFEKKTVRGSGLIVNRLKIELSGGN
jgi:hypothetical protein